MSGCRNLPFTPDTSFLDLTDIAVSSTPTIPNPSPSGNQQSNVCSNGSAEVILPSILDSTEKIAILKHQDPTELLRYFRSELDVSKVNHMKNHLWLAGQHRSCRPLHMQKVLGREIVVVEICHLHLTWRDATIFIKPCPDFLLDYSTWKTYLSTEKELYRNALGFLITYTSLVRRKSDLKVAHELGLLPATLGWARWNQLSRLIVGTPFEQFVKENNGNSGAESKVYDRWCYGELRLGRLNWIHRLCFCSERERGQFQRGFFNQYQDYRSFLNRNITWLTVSTIYVALVLNSMQVGLGTDRLNNNGRFTDAAVGFTLFSIIAPLTVIVLIAAIMLYKFADNWLYTIHKMRTHRAPL
ncbi:hypothetical protein EJ07DRAFT_160130 [Lizonia empirigonia]|nr:hypothetical protein EJ07DRAFT_160130 [Lizonia empirigonia]